MPYISTVFAKKLAKFYITLGKTSELSLRGSIRVRISVSFEDIIKDLVYRLEY